MPAEFFVVTNATDGRAASKPAGAPVGAAATVLHNQMGGGLKTLSCFPERGAYAVRAATVTPGARFVTSRQFRRLEGMGA